MTLFEKALNVVKTVSESIVSGSLLAPKETIQHRSSLCETCESFNKTTHTCKMCGCFLPTKILLSKAQCPKKIWF